MSSSNGPLKGSKLALAISLVCIEFLAGIQSYLLNGVMPEIARSMGSSHVMGWSTAATQAALFAGMPLGPYLAHRWRASRVLVGGTLVSVLGGVISALATNAAIFSGGCAVRGLSAGVLSSVSMSIVGVALGEKLRQVVMSFMSVSWLVAGIIGPLYATLLSDSIGWRWALVAYLPLLLIARVVVGKALGTAHDQALRGGRLPRTAVLLSLVLGAVAMGVSGGPWSIGIACAGAVITMIALRSLFGGMTGPRRSTLDGLALLSGLYYAVTAVIATVIVLGFGGSLRAGALGLAACGVTRALAGVVVARTAPSNWRAIERRSIAGFVSIALGLAGSVASTFQRIGSVELFTGSVVFLGLGMALLYADSFSVLFSDHDDGVTASEMGSRVALAEAIGGAIGMCLAYSMIGTNFGGLSGSGHMTVRVLYGTCLFLWVLCAQKFTTHRGRDYRLTHDGG